MIFNLTSTDDADEMYSDEPNRDIIKEYTKQSTIELNSLEELIEFLKEIKCEIVVSMYDETTQEIEIYNGYRE